MEYKVISADCHIDLIWLPPTLFTDRSPKNMRDRMPFVKESAEGSVWVSNQGV